MIKKTILCLSLLSTTPVETQYFEPPGDRHFQIQSRRCTTLRLYIINKLIINALFLIAHVNSQSPPIPAFTSQPMATTTASAHQASSSSNKKNQTQSISQTVFSINHQPLISTIKADTIMYIYYTKSTVILTILNHKQTLLLTQTADWIKVYYQNQLFSHKQPNN